MITTAAEDLAEITGTSPQLPHPRPGTVLDAPDIQDRPGTLAPAWTALAHALETTAAGALAAGRRGAGTRPSPVTAMIHRSWCGPPSARPAVVRNVTGRTLVARSA